MVTSRVQLGVRMVVAFALALALLASPHTFAEESKNNAANTLKVSPVRTDIQVKPGDKRKVEMTVTNLTNKDIMLHPVENDFVAGDESGAPALILDENKYAPTHSLKRFMTPIEDFTVPAKDAVTVSVDIVVPTDANPGGYFGAVRFAPTSPDEGGQVNLSASVASLILLTVPGDTVEQMALTDFDIRQDGKTNTFFTSPNDLNASVRFENKGNVQLGPIGKISVTKGDEVVYEADFNQENPAEVVLPDSARRWDIPLKKIGSFGNYKVTATFTYGKKNQSIEVTKSFWVVPLSVIFITIGGVLLLVGIIIAIWLFLRSYKRRILRSNSGFRR